VVERLGWLNEVYEGLRFITFVNGRMRMKGLGRREAERSLR